MISTGDPAPWFRSAASNNPNFDFSSCAGRYIVLAFYGSAADPGARAALATVERNRHLFDDAKASFFGVSNDSADLDQNRVEQIIPGIRYFWDFDGKVTALYGLRSEDRKGRMAIMRRWFVLDPMLRVIASLPLDGSDGGLATVMALIETLPPVAVHAGGDIWAPVLVLPRVFEPAFCRKLIDLYEHHGGEESGFMREQDGRTVKILDESFKRRADYEIADEDIQAAARERIRRRIVPEIQKAFQFKATRMERYLVACYDASKGGHFRAHRDNTTKGTAHRRFACSLNLNAEDYAGGDLRFPEFGPRTYRAPTGGVVVFSCSLLHEATPVTAGRRFAFLPFLYDDEAARIRETNIGFIDDGSHRYQAEASGKPN